MFKTMIMALAAGFISTSAMAVGIQIQNGDEITAISPVVKLDVTVKNSKEAPQKITLESLNRKPWNSKMVKFPKKDFTLLPGNGQGNIPMFLKIEKKGKFRVVICAAEEPFKYEKKSKDGVEVNVTVRACDSITIIRR